jgi:hypothetical protein
LDLLGWRGDVKEMGSTVCYHTGFIMKDRHKDPKVDAIAHDAWSLYIAGRVLLTQRKINDMKYSYLVTSCDGPRVRQRT